MNGAIQNIRPYPAAYPTKTIGSATTSSVRFGAGLNLIGQGLIQGVLKEAGNANNPQNKNTGGGGWKSFLQRNLIWTTLLTAILANADVVYRQTYYIHQNINGKPLDSVLDNTPHGNPPLAKPPEGTPLTPAGQPVAETTPTDTPPKEELLTPEQIQKLITLARTNHVIVTTTTLLDMAKAGLISEIHSPVSDKSIAPGLVPWNAVLIDGSVIKTEMNEDTRKQLIKNHNIPVLHPTTGIQLGWLEASILAALIVNGLSGLSSATRDSIASLRNRRKERQPTLTDNDKRRYAMHETARLLVASVLGVEPPIPLTIENIEAQMGLTTPNKNLNPITLSKYKKNMAMYLAGPALEDTLYPGDPSVFSSGALDAVSVMARVLVTKLGMGPVYEKYIPDVIIPDSNKQKLQDEARKLFDEAYEKAKSIIEQHANRIEELQRANQTVKKLTRKEVLGILGGKTTEDIIQDRRWFVRLKRKLIV